MLGLLFRLHSELVHVNKLNLFSQVFIFDGSSNVID